MGVITVPSLSKNYSWILTHHHQALVIDPSEAAPLIERLHSLGLVLEGILITHHHADHWEGLDALLAAYPETPVYAPVHPELAAVTTHPLTEGDSVIWSGEPVAVWHLPGHTLTHLGYYAAPYFFCGDTLFGAGCGRLFEGTPSQLYHSLQRIAQLPPMTQLCWAHEYTLDNLQFTLQLTTDAKVLHRLAQTAKQRQQGLPTVPVTLATECATNVFLRCHEPAIKAKAEAYALAPLADPLAVFTVLRQWRSA